MHDVKAYIKHFLAFLLIHFKLTTYGSKSNEAHVLNIIITKMMNKLSKLDEEDESFLNKKVFHKSLFWGILRIKEQ